MSAAGPRMVFVFVSVTLAVALFLGMLVFLELGRRLGRRHIATDTSARAGVGVVEGVVYGLLALLVGFMFSGAAGRFDRRRELVAQQQNAASTAWLRVSLLPADQQPAIRAGFRRYMDELIAYYTSSSNSDVLLSTTPAFQRAESELWSTAVAACTTSTGERARILLLPALNEMFDDVDMERMSRRIHPPITVFLMLGVAALATALFAGYGMAGSPKRNWIYTLGIAATISIAAYAIIELEYPRVGLIRVDPMDQVLREFRASMD
jgi:hypothetical protein